MSPTMWNCLTAASAALLGFWLSRRSLAQEIARMQADVERAQKGESEWAQLAVRRQAVIVTLEDRAVADVATIEELRAQVAASNDTQRRRVADLQAQMANERSYGDKMHAELVLSDTLLKRARFEREQAPDIEERIKRDRAHWRQEAAEQALVAASHSSQLLWFRAQQQAAAERGEPWTISEEWSREQWQRGLHGTVSLHTNLWRSEHWKTGEWVRGEAEKLRESS